MSNLPHIVTTLTVAITSPGENPVLSERAVHVTLDDQGRGPYITITTHTDCDTKAIDLDLDELEAIVVEARRLIAQPGVKS